MSFLHVFHCDECGARSEVATRGWQESVRDRYDPQTRTYGTWTEALSYPDSRAKHRCPACANASKTKEATDDAIRRIVREELDAFAARLRDERTHPDTLYHDLPPEEEGSACLPLKYDSPPLPDDYEPRARR